MDFYDELSRDPGCLFWASDAYLGCLDTEEFPDEFVLRSNTPEAQSQPPSTAPSRLP